MAGTSPAMTQEKRGGEMPPLRRMNEMRLRSELRRQPQHRAVVKAVYVHNLAGRTGCSQCMEVAVEAIARADLRAWTEPIGEAGLRIDIEDRRRYQKRSQ